MNKKTIIFGSIACVVLALGAVLFFFNTPTGGTAGDGASFTTQAVGDRQSESAEGHRFSISSWADREGNSGTDYYMDGEKVSKLKFYWYFNRQ